MDDEFIEQVRHLACMATDPGFLAHAKHRSKELEQVWPGITEAVREEINRFKACKEREVR